MRAESETETVLEMSVETMREPSEPEPTGEPELTPAEREALDAAAGGDLAPLERLLDGYRHRLRRVVEFRMHPGIAGRADASDVVQESLFEVISRLPQYLDQRRLPFYLWVRFLTTQKLQQFHRRHLDAAGRDARRERPVDAPLSPHAASSMILANALSDGGMTPSQVASKEEEIDELRGALDRLSEQDREVLALRHFEHLSNGEVARVLDIQESAASRRYLRALERLGQMLGSD